MAETTVLPELKQILGAMILASVHPLTVAQMRKCLQEVAEKVGGELAVFVEVGTRDVKAALDELEAELKKSKCGMLLHEVGGGYRVLSDSACGPWLKHLLNADKPQRLSQPALETLAIIAYRQPIAKADIEAVRGVSVDHMIKSLMELQLVKIAGRSELPGRPFLYGTTQSFLEHFGLRSLKELDDIEPMLKEARENAKREARAKYSKPEPQPGQTDQPQSELDLEAGKDSPPTGVATVDELQAPDASDADEDTQDN